MKATEQLHEAGQSLWLDNIRRDLLTTGTLAGYIDDLSVTGLTSNPTIFDKAIKGSADYDADIRKLLGDGKDEEAIFFDLALDDICGAADLFRPIWERTSGGDGYVSLEVSPRLANDTETTIKEAKALFARADRPNLLIKVPGTPEGNVAVEELIASGVNVNVTLLFSREQYQASAEAYLRGLERRREAGEELKVGSVASVFISRWDVASVKDLSDDLKDRLGVAVGKQTYAAYREVLASDRWQSLANDGALPQRLLWASTGTKDPDLPDTYYIEALASPHTVNTMPEGTLKAFGDHGTVGDMLPADGGDAEEVLAEMAAEGIDKAALAAELQVDGAKKFDDSWDELLACIKGKGQELAKAS